MKHKKRAVIYDFDGTLVDSPDRERGEFLYMEAHGKGFPFGGWWGRIESLMPPVFPDPLNESILIADTIAAYRQDRLCDESHLILMTGRPYKNRRRIQEILAHFNVQFDSEYYRGMPGQIGSDTITIKLNIIRNEILHNRLEILEIWEDRPEHTSIFMDFAKKLKSKHDNNLRSIIVHDVKNKNHIEF